MINLIQPVPTVDGRFLLFISGFIRLFLFHYSSNNPTCTNRWYFVLNDTQLPSFLALLFVKEEVVLGLE